MSYSTNARRFAARHRAAVLAALLAAVSFSPAAAHDYAAGAIRIDHPWSRATPPGATVGAGYLTLRNGGAAEDRFLGATSPLAARVEIHEMTVDNGVMTMRARPDGVPLPPGATVALEPGGLHLMLFGLKRPLGEGERVPLTLRFANEGTAEAQLQVEKLTAGAPSHGMEMPH